MKKDNLLQNMLLRVMSLERKINFLMSIPQMELTNHKKLYDDYKEAESSFLSQIGEGKIDKNVEDDYIILKGFVGIQFFYPFIQKLDLLVKLVFENLNSKEYEEIYVGLVEFYELDIVNFDRCFDILSQMTKRRRKLILRRANYESFLHDSIKKHDKETFIDYMVKCGNQAENVCKMATGAMKLEEIRKMLIAKDPLMLSEGCQVLSNAGAEVKNSPTIRKIMLDLELLSKIDRTGDCPPQKDVVEIFSKLQYYTFGTQCSMLQEKLSFFHSFCMGKGGMTRELFEIYLDNTFRKCPYCNYFFYPIFFRVLYKVGGTDQIKSYLEYWTEKGMDDVEKLKSEYLTDDFKPKLFPGINLEIWPLDADYFYQKPLPDKRIHLTLSKDILKIESLSDKLSKFIDYLAEIGCIEDKPEMKASFVQILTGMPAGVSEAVTWNGKARALYYITMILCDGEKGKYQKIYALTNCMDQLTKKDGSVVAGSEIPPFSKGVDEDYPGFKSKIDDIFGKGLNKY